MSRLAPFSSLPRPLRWIARAITLLLVLAIALVLFGTWTVRRSFPVVDGTITLGGLDGQVTVYRDRYGIPHIYADTPADLVKAQGYVHAQDRFWEMDFRRKTTAGRLSELFGDSTLEVDKVVRTLGWRRVAEQELQRITPATRGYLEAYAEGVNAWMAGHTGADASLEFAVLGLTNRGYKPEPWTPADSLAWLKAMAWDLRGNMEDELGRALAAATMPRERVEELWPPYPFAEHKPIVTNNDLGRDGPGPSARPTATANGAALREAGVALRAAARALSTAPNLIGGGTGTGIGSNSWVVAGSRTVTGKPLLANDPHLAPHMPSIWYQAGLHCRRVGPACPFDVTGFTFSGVPGVIIGHNHRIAWGFTNLGPDVTDLFVERVRGDAYEFQGRWLPLETRTERIEVAGGEPVTLTVRSTRHGPIISDVMQDARDALASTPAATPRVLPAGQAYGIALRWTALDPGRTADAIPLLNTATNWTQFREAARLFEVPAQNLVYADVDGNIGYQAPGRIPVRAKGDGRWPAPGWTGAYEWTSYIPFERLPTVRNPRQGFIVTANNAVASPDYPFLLTHDWSYGYRSSRIEERLAAAPKLDVAGMEQIQHDDRNPFAPLLVPYLNRVELPDSARAVRNLLNDWQYEQNADSAAAAYFNAVWRHLMVRTFNDDLEEGARPTDGDRWFEVVGRLLQQPDDPWWDDIGTSDRQEDRDDILRQAMVAARDELAARLGEDERTWSWGKLHTLELTNDTFGTSGIAPIEWLFNRGPLRLGGNSDSVNATGWNYQTGYEVDWVPSMRMVVDLADLDRSRWINLTGASGHAFARTYWDQARLWAAGETTPMRAREDTIRAEAWHTLTLTP
jgi:penicillin G amidase